jgi:hypothetical protein
MNAYWQLTSGLRFNGLNSAEASDQYINAHEHSQCNADRSNQKRNGAGNWQLVSQLISKIKTSANPKCGNHEAQATVFERSHNFLLLIVGLANSVANKRHPYKYRHTQ